MFTSLNSHFSLNNPNPLLHTESQPLKAKLLLQETTQRDILLIWNKMSELTRKLQCPYLNINAYPAVG